MNAQVQTALVAQAATGSLDLDKFNTVLVKFFFTNDKHVPRGIPNVARKNDFAVDYKHMRAAKEAGADDLGAVGRHREGRVDTGEPIIKDLHGVQASLLKDRLIKAGFAIKNLHWYKQERASRIPKFVVVCEFVRGIQTEELPQDVIAALDFLSYCARWTCHVWDNSQLGKPATINFVGRQPDGKVQYYLSLIENTITAIPA